MASVEENWQTLTSLSKYLHLSQQINCNSLVQITVDAVSIDTALYDCNLPVGLSVGVVTVLPLLSSWFLLLQLSSSFFVRVTPSSTTEFFSCCWPCTLATAELFSSEQSISECLAHLSLLRCIRCESFWRGFSRQNHYISTYSYCIQNGSGTRLGAECNGRDKQDTCTQDKMCVRVRLHRKRAATRSRNSGSSEDEESGGDQEGRDSLQVVTLLVSGPVSPYSFTSHPPSFSFLPPSFILLLPSPFFFCPFFPSLVFSSQHSSMSHVDVVRSSHRLPDSSCLDNERKLQRIATRGGTQLHNNLECNVLCIHLLSSI